MRTVPTGSPLLRGVVALGDANRRTTGLLPHAAWDDYARSGHLVAAVHLDRPDTPAAYAAFRLPREEVVLAHLVVAADARGQGLARLLVKHLSDAHPERRGLAA